MSSPRAVPGATPGLRRGLRYLGLVVVGGAAGTALRVAVAAVIPGGSASTALLVTNLLGSLLLGILLGFLESRSRRHGSPSARRDELRLLLGPGLLGGFTSYSALSVIVAQTLGVSPVSALVYGLASVVGGVLLAGIGYVLMAPRATEAPAPEAETEEEAAEEAAESAEAPDARPEDSPEATS